jgi:signal recognition particle receptor subunit beta
MVLFNYSTKELTAKVVYYGAGLCGKTTNLQWIHEKLPIKSKGKMLSLATETDRTLFFDFLPIELGSIRGMKTRIQLYTVPGQVFYNATRRMVLKGADCVVFVCDSQEAMVEPNLESFENLRQNLEANEISADEIPMVLQYNKRDLPNALPIEILNERLNPRGLQFFEAIAVKGTGVEDTLKAATGLVFRSLANKYGPGEAAHPPLSGATPLPGPATPPPPRPAVPAAAAAAPPLKAATTTLPPLNMQPAAPAEEILDSLELQPALEDEEPVVAEDGELELPAPHEDEIALPEALPVEPIEELSFDVSPPSPLNPKDTLVSKQEESEDLRRRIGRPSYQEVILEETEEEIEAEEEEVEELSFDSTPTPTPTPPRPTPAVVAPASEGEPVYATARVRHINAAPIEVQLQAVQGQTAVAIPVEVTIENGTARVAIQLNVTLNLRLTP